VDGVGGRGARVENSERLLEEIQKNEAELTEDSESESDPRRE